MKDAILLILGGALGVAFSELYHAWRTASRRSRGARNEGRRLKRESLLPQAVLEFYQSANLQSELYQPRTVSVGPIALLERADFSGGQIVQPRSESVVVVTSTDVDQYPVDDKVIEDRRKAGVNLWDGLIIYATSCRRTENGEMLISAGTANYYGYVTLAHRIQQELLQPQRGRPVLEGYYRNATDAMSGALKPVAISAAAACVFEKDGRLDVAVHRRSANTVNAPNSLAAGPLFGMESNRNAQFKSEYGVVFYNFVKEFVEEFYGLDALIRAVESPALDPDWIMRLPQAAAVIAEFDAGRATLICDGVGVECTDGTITLGLVAHFTSPDFRRKFEADARPGWELSSVRPAGRSVEFWPLDGSDLGNAMNPSRMSATSIFVLDLARRRLLRASKS